MSTWEFAPGHGILCINLAMLSLPVVCSAVHEAQERVLRWAGWVSSCLESRGAEQIGCSGGRWDWRHFPRRKTSTLLRNPWQLTLAKPAPGLMLFAVSIVRGFTVGWG